MYIQLENGDSENRRSAGRRAYADYTLKAPISAVGARGRRRLI
jgi:hypothetical protein